MQNINFNILVGFEVLENTEFEGSVLYLELKYPNPIVLSRSLNVSQGRRGSVTLLRRTYSPNLSL